jgi:ankyrin repeat protein
LTRAAEQQQVDVVKTLLDLGANAKLATPLLPAALGGNTDIISVLISKGADVNGTDERWTTPLILAAAGRNIEALELLLRHGAKACAADRDGMTPLMGAVRVEHRGIVQKLVTIGCDLNAKNKQGQTALMIAASGGDAEIGGILRQAGAKESPDSALMFAVGSDNVSAVLQAITQGANVNAAADELGWTPLLMASRAGYTDLVRALLGHGADPNARDKVKGYGDSCLMQAAAKGHVEIVKDLIRKGARVNDANEQGFTPLIYAAWFGHLEVVEILLKAGTRINAKAKNGDTALKLAEKHGYPEVAEILRRESKKK